MCIRDRLVDQGGCSRIQVTPLQLFEESAPVRVGLATQPVDTGEVFLYHKTTQRQVYEAARSSRPDCDDVLLWNQRGELTESCLANLVIELDGQLITPPVACGLLAGTMRAELLATGVIREGVVPVDALARASRVILVNSVRGWREAVIQP
jgi:para-aminobenzoate synthetase/4-amino-4-deoxychorismate lyase